MKGIPPAAQGEQNIKVVFEITDEGILRVTAKIVSTGGEEEIEIKEHKGRLSDQDLQKLISQVIQVNTIFWFSLFLFDFRD